MKSSTPTIPVELDRYLATHSAAEITSTAVYLERGGLLVTPSAVTGLRTLRSPLAAKMAALEPASVLRRRLEMLVLYLDETCAERASLSPAIREATFGLLYFLKGFDRIPDSVPEVGLLDDALIVRGVFERHAAALRGHWLRRRRTWPLED